jgi:hypothetical protein
MEGRPFLPVSASNARFFSGLGKPSKMATNNPQLSLPEAQPEGKPQP